MTPDNYGELEEAMAAGYARGLPFPWSWCSGSLRFSLCMASLPFLRAVLFPVDLRYGRDLKHRPRRVKLERAGENFKPRVAAMEPRRKYWSRMGAQRDAQDTPELRQSEYSTLKLMASRAIKVAKDSRGNLFENPRSSSIWSKSPLAAWADHPSCDRHRYNACMRALSNETKRRDASRDILF